MAYTTIDDPGLYFNTKLFTGNGSTNAITGVGFQPDFIWFKNRTSAQSHVVIDSVRGRLGLQPNETNTEYSLTSGRDFATFDSDGFTVENPETYNSFNYSTGSIVSWNWKAGTSFTNDASGTGIGSIDSAGSFNNDSGFSIVSWTGTGSAGTIKHGLSTTPSMIIVKKRSEATGSDWCVYHISIGATKRAVLNSTGAIEDNSTFWNDTSPTSSVFSVGTDQGINDDGETFIGYCFAEKQGFSKFGSYTGNGNADGTFCFTGFKPAFVIAKRTDSTSSWQMWDNTRDIDNVVTHRLRADVTTAEDTGSVDVDFLSNGWKLKSTGINISGGTYIYMAIAENPFVSSSGVPACAR